ncbi:MAG: arsenate reductase ArsC [Desulfovibrio sp.]|nr:arsenate reductase ArsC [Desulfovibrio sp.]MCA1984896.1 arsenate reductase ArsC [Desulfovibrio sp.]
MKKTRILFLCTGNSCRSQMAEGWARALKSEELDVASAGIVRHGMNPRAVQAMAEAGVDISGQSSKTIDDLPSLDFDWIITLCGHANESCPMVFGPAKRLHVGFDDPPALAAGAVTEEEAMAPYRRVRDEIKQFIEGLPESLSA